MSTTSVSGCRPVVDLSVANDGSDVGNSAVELRDARLRGVDPSKDPHTRGARLRVWLVSLVESATFMAVAYQLDQPPSFDRDPGACLVAWGFIVARALTAPICAMYLATLGKRALVRREMYGYHHPNLQHLVDIMVDGGGVGIHT